MIPRQIHVNIIEINRNRFFEEVSSCSDHKPWGGGLWASDYCEEYGSDWVRYMRNQRYTHKYWGVSDVLIYEIVPNPTARVYIIDSEESLDVFYGRYGYAGCTYEFDWREVIRDYDAVYLADYSLLDSWDCASSVWFRWEAFQIRELTQEEVVNKIEMHLEELTADGDAW